MSADKHLLKLTNIVKNTLLIANQHQVQCSVTANINSGLGLNVRMQELDTIEHNQNSEISITIYKNNKQGTVNTTSLELDNINKAIEKAISIATFTENDPYCGLPDPDLIVKKIIDLDLYHPQNITPEIAVNIAKKCEQIGLNYDSCIKNSEGAMFSYSNSFTAIGNSYDFIAAYPTTSYSLACNLIAEEQGSMQRDGDYTIARNFKDLTPLEIIGNNAGLYTASKLGAIKISTNKSKVLFTPRIAAKFFNYLIAAISGHNIANNSSFLINKINHQIFPKFINIIDEPFINRGLRSACFDADGIATKSQFIITEGKLNTYLLSNYFAKKLNLIPTGHANGIHNLFIINNTNPITPNVNWATTKISHETNRWEKSNELIQQMQNGLIVTETIGQGVNLVTGDYSKGACGFWVENGKISHPVEEITIAGNLVNMFEDIISIGNDVDYQNNIITGSVLINNITIAGR